MSLKNKDWTIAICLDVRQKASRDIVEGVMRCVVAHGGANVMLLGNHPCNDGFERMAGGEPDVLVGTCNLLRTGAYRSMLFSPHVRATIFFGSWGTMPLPYPATSLVADDRQIGATAARVLVRSGLRDFAYLGAPQGDRWSAARRDAFAEALAEAGYGLAADYSPLAKRPNWRREWRHLTDWVLSLPKPCGVFAAFDQRARHLLSVCRTQGVPVPQQIQVLGADDEEYICENEIPSLSSIAIDFRGAAQTAMQAVFEHLEDGEPLPRNIMAGVAGFTERLSTCDMSRTGERVNRARDIIRLHAAEGIDPAGVARRVGGSLRLLESGFRAVLGRTVAEELRETRLSKAARLLEDTELPASEIAARVGFGSGRSLMTVFKRRYGVSMGQWRRSARSGGTPDS
jgi:LacI family transcriptional regulator